MSVGTYDLSQRRPENTLSDVHVVTGSVRRSLVGAKTGRDAVYTTRHVDTYCFLASTVWRTRPNNKIIKF